MHAHEFGVFPWISQLGFYLMAHDLCKIELSKAMSFMVTYRTVVSKRLATKLALH